MGGWEKRGWEGGDRPWYELVKGGLCATERLLSQRSVGLNSMNRCGLMIYRPLSFLTDDLSKNGPCNPRTIGPSTDLELTRMTAVV